MVLLLLAILSPFLTKTQIAILAITFGGLYLIYRRIKKKQRYWEEKGIDFVKPKFLLGYAEIRKTKAHVEVLRDGYNQFPNARYFGVYSLTRPVLVIKDPELLKLIAVKEFDSFHDHRKFYDEKVDPLWGNNLLTSTGEKWRALRITLSPAFTSTKMRMLFELMEECSSQFMEHVREQAEAEVDMKDVMLRFTSNVIASTAFGLKVDSLKDRENEFFTIMKDACGFGYRSIALILLHSFSPSFIRLMGWRFIPKKVADYFTQLIGETIKTRETNNIVRPDLIYLLMEARKNRLKHEEDQKMNEGFSSTTEGITNTNSTNKVQLTMEDIVSNAFSFFFAGSDTTSTFISFTLYELAVNPDVQSRLRDEIEETLKVTNGKITYESLLGMKYLDMVASEILRKWPSAATSDRQVTKPFTVQPEKSDEKSLHLEKGQLLFIPIYSIHNDPNFYPNPSKFDPERFSEEKKANIVPYSYLPFGVGPRNCLGSRYALLVGKLLIVSFLKEFEVTPVARTHIPMVLDKNQYHLCSEGGLWLRFKKIATKTG